MWISIVILPIIIFIPVWRQVLRVSKLRQNWRYALNLPLICRILDVRFLSTIWNQSKLQISLKLGVVQGLDEKTAWCLSAKSCFRERPCERPYMKRFLFFDTNVTARNPSVVPRFRDYGRAGRYLGCVVDFLECVCKGGWSPVLFPGRGKTRLWKNHSINLLLSFSMLHLLSRVWLSRLKEFCASRSAIHSN